MKLLNYCIILFLITSLISGCIMQKNTGTEGNSEKTPDETSDFPDVGEMDEELDTKTLETLEEDLEYIENI